MVEALPRQFGSYVLERRLGVGGMAETFVARRAAYDGVEQRVRQNNHQESLLK